MVGDWPFPQDDPAGHQLELGGHRSCSAWALRSSNTGRSIPSKRFGVEEIKMSRRVCNTYHQPLLVKAREIVKLSPDTIKGYQALSAAGRKTALLGAKTRELISLAIAIRCDGCIAVRA
jgi:hypothetical protein